MLDHEVESHDQRQNNFDESFRRWLSDCIHSAQTTWFKYSRIDSKTWFSEVAQVKKERAHHTWRFFATNPISRGVSEENCTCTGSQAGTCFIQYWGYKWLLGRNKRSAKSRILAWVMSSKRAVHRKNRLRLRTCRLKDLISYILTTAHSMGVNLQPRWQQRSYRPRRRRLSLLF